MTTQTPTAPATAPAPTTPAPATAPAVPVDPAMAAELTGSTSGTGTDPGLLAELTAMVTTMRAEIAALSEAKQAPAPVPTTDQGKPTITPTTPDPSTLPPVARMAAGYRK